MDVILCNNASEANIINKSIVPLATASCILKGPVSVMTPIFILSYNGTLDPAVNYLSVPELDRKYFVTDIINLTGGRFEVHGKVDVLESFADSILALSAIIDKQEGPGASNMYLDDGSYMVENKEFNSVINFSNGFNATGEYVLITAGGGGGII